MTRPKLSCRLLLLTCVSRFLMLLVALSRCVSSLNHFSNLSPTSTAAAFARLLRYRSAVPTIVVIVLILTVVTVLTAPGIKEYSHNSAFDRHTSSEALNTQRSPAAVFAWLDSRPIPLQEERLAFMTGIPAGETHHALLPAGIRRSR